MDPVCDPILFRGLSGGQRETLMRAARSLSFADKDVLIAMGGTERDILCLLTGSATVQADDGRLLSVLGPGDSVGEIGFLSGKKRTANVVARGDGEALLISGDLLDWLVRDEPAIAARLLLNLSRELAARLATTTQMALL
jgi:CRP-like cAMP-binding protein